MTDATVAAAAPAPAKKAAKKPAKPKTTAVHPSYVDMIVTAVQTLKERNGSSRQAILKYVLANYDVGPESNMVRSHLKKALSKASASGVLKHTKGTGASGSFKVGEKSEKPKVAKKAPKEKKETVPKEKKETASKEKKVAKKPKSPKKAKVTAEKIAASPKAAKKAKAPKVGKANSPAKPKASKKSPAKKTAAKPKAATKKTEKSAKPKAAKKA